MAKKEYLCQVMRVLVTTHSYGSPMTVDDILRRAAIPSHDIGKAKDAVEYARALSFIRDCGNRGIMLESGEFQVLAQFLYSECDWEQFELELRLKHFEGWDELDW